MIRIHRSVVPGLALFVLTLSACDTRNEPKLAPAKVEKAVREKEEPRPSPAKPDPGGFECAVLVRGASGDPLTSVHVDFLLGGSLVSGKLTDERGIARFRVRAGNYDVRISGHDRAVLATVGYEISGDTPTPIEVVIGRKERP
jgi:hypothetical protein